MPYPSGIDAPSTSMQGTTLIAVDDHALDHRTLGSAIIAVENKLGIGSGSAAANQILVGSGAGTTSWGTVWNNATLGTPTITLGSDAQGDLFYRASGGTLTRLAPGSSGQLLQTQGASANPIWADRAANDGWTLDSNTWTFASASTFTVTGDQTATFRAGTRLRFTQSAAVKYAVVISSAFGSNTTVTILVNTDYTIANAAISATSYSYQESPQGYPTIFNFSVTATTSGTAFTNPPTINKATCSVRGSQAIVKINFTYNGTSGGTGNTLLTIPITPATTNQSGWGVNNNAGLALIVFTNGTSAQLVVARYDSSTNIGNNQQSEVGALINF